MIGNDVVDLGDAETREGATHPRFDERVFSAEEREALATSGAPNRLRWLLWAAKEAAYKLGRKRDPALVFSPRRFAVRLAPDLTGVVRYEGCGVAVRVSDEQGALHAVASEAPGSEWLAGVAAIDPNEDASSAVRRFAGERIARSLRVPTDSIAFDRVGRVPTLRVAERPHGVDVSLSHHGRFIAFACDLGGAR